MVWLTDDLIIGQREQPTGAWAVCTAPAVAGPWTPLVVRGCNFIAAGGGNWAAFGGSIFGPAAIPGAAIPAGLDGRGAGAPDGTVALIKHPETGGLLLVRLDGSLYENTLAFPTDKLCVVNRSQALWVDARDGAIHTCGGLPIPVTLPGPVLWPSVFQAMGTWWIAYHSTDAVGYVCHPFGSLTGYRICTPPAFYPHAIALTESIARFAWSVDSAESPSAVRVVDQPLTAPRVPLNIHTEPPIIVNETPKESIMLAYASPVAGFLPGDLVDNGNGTVSVKKPNGKYLCCTPEGRIEERDTPGGLWESFRKSKSSLIAERDGGARGPQIFVLPLAE